MFFFSLQEACAKRKAIKAVQLACKSNNIVASGFSSLFQTHAHTHTHTILKDGAESLKGAVLTDCLVCQIGIDFSHRALLRGESLIPVWHFWPSPGSMRDFPYLAGLKH